MHRLQMMLDKTRSFLVLFLLLFLLLEMTGCVVLRSRYCCYRRYCCGCGCWVIGAPMVRRDLLSLALMQASRFDCCSNYHCHGCCLFRDFYRLYHHCCYATR